MNKFENKYLKIVRDIILNQINKTNTTVFLFGSRALKDFRHSSDIDIGFISKENMDKIFMKINELLEESIVPYHVDLIDFKKVDENFKKTALKKIIVWNEGKNMKIN